MPPLGSRFLRRCEALAFWSAILLAGSYPLLLIAVNQDWVALEAFLGVISAHLVALAAGRGYADDRTLPS